ncbi:MULTISPECIES: DUF4389 domain-containing protein [unclassified Pseudofrankia]|uniref:DUF4389 domain-containing protein n=1 Tax=unclassified Pseudofrankia TaxID=2994372 RepID=UPI0008DA5744|nr:MULTISPECIES: DUF4389 domain-containing protein [unclassified Pseudofrankia]MDT3441093.1 DUF4389 domain-containing protein [Pseudofrankia sp. BMG5.37]OHV54291.1 hypothetical protein BCD48_09560 [Pseudofrankia sp. BMG5.36]
MSTVTDQPRPTGQPAYPVRIDAAPGPDSELSRWLWLVKWVLAIPHAIVLFFLWIAALVLSIGAFFAILFTGRYPRAVFSFNVGVLRWSWRVNYYSYGALATDRYPPFTLGEVPDYPARLSVAYPDRLSRGLVLVKSWLLAIPHYLIVGRLGNALAGLLTLFAGVIMLFTGRYPQSVYDLVLGLRRWALRVCGYAMLMTDSYPPLRLDMGGPDPAASDLT